MTAFEILTVIITSGTLILTGFTVWFLRSQVKLQKHQLTELISQNEIAKQSFELNNKMLVKKHSISIITPDFFWNSDSVFNIQIVNTGDIPIKIWGVSFQKSDSSNITNHVIKILFQASTEEMIRLLPEEEKTFEVNCKDLPKHTEMKLICMYYHKNDNYNKRVLFEANNNNIIH